ncbi:hypothetical protein THAOC_00340 [Thalassiosira oceanica]|uniref:Uncharacterized protein n=1 Tax=Thalassiosira oceanica TaxID=159749 RepID=K0TGF0_THAOC|nr:hypothetical protein THAOC_00340 [Thalassiosira oceanica]|eukprot:EJK77803.1 hypothetical protein THAOC_00340 [Thalassiosira oceanica]
MVGKPESTGKQLIDDAELSGEATLLATNREKFNELAISTHRSNNWGTVKALMGGKRMLQRLERNINEEESRRMLGLAITQRDIEASAAQEKFFRMNADAQARKTDVLKARLVGQQDSMKLELGKAKAFAKVAGYDAIDSCFAANFDMKANGADSKAAAMSKAAANDDLRGAKDPHRIKQSREVRRSIE